MFELPFGSPAFLHDASTRSGSPATRSTRSCTSPATPTAVSRTGPRSAPARRSSTSTRSGSPASTSCRSCSRNTGRWRRRATSPTSSPPSSGRGCMTRTCCAPTRCRSRRDLHRGPLRRAALQRGDRGARARRARLGDQRVRPQRAARPRRAHPRPPARPCPWTRLNSCATGSRRSRRSTPRCARSWPRSSPTTCAWWASSTCRSRSSRRKILAIVAVRTGAVEDAAAADAAEQRFRETTTAMSAIPAPAGPPPADDLKTLFRDAAKRMHPDLVADDAGRGHAEAFMKRLNQAYKAGRRGGHRQPRPPVGDVPVRVREADRRRCGSGAGRGGRPGRGSGSPRRATPTSPA